MHRLSLSPARGVPAAARPLPRVASATAPVSRHAGRRAVSRSPPPRGAWAPKGEARCDAMGGGVGGMPLLWTPTLPPPFLSRAFGAPH